MKNKEIELILTKLKIVSEEKENGAYICDKEHSKLLLSYIEQLKKEYKLLKDRNEINIDRNIEAYRIVEKLENNRDKAIEYIEKYKYYTHSINADYLLNILKGDSDEI